MTKIESIRLRQLLNSHKRVWRKLAEESEKLLQGTEKSWYKHGERQQARDAVQAVVFYFRLKIPVSMHEIPVGVDLREYVIKPGEALGREYPEPSVKGKCDAVDEA